MAARYFQAAKASAGSGVPETQGMVTDSAATFIRGALVVVASDGELEECGADPAAVFGVALAAAGSAPGYGIGHSPSVVTNRSNRVSVALASVGTVFSGRGVNGGTDPVTPLQTHITEKYGVAKDSDGYWYVDISDTTNKVVEITDIDANTYTFFFKFLTGVIQAPAAS